MALEAATFTAKADAQTYVQGTPVGFTRFGFWDDGTHHGFLVGELGGGFGATVVIISSDDFEDHTVANFAWGNDYLDLLDGDGALLLQVTGFKNALGLDQKVDVVLGKALSTNDYDDAAKALVDGLTAALDLKQDKEVGKGLSTNDFTNDLQTKLQLLESPLAKGYYETLAALQAFVPTPVEKSFAYVKNGAGNYDLYVFEGLPLAWANKGEASGSVTIAELKVLINAAADVHLLTTTEQAAIAGLDTRFAALDTKYLSEAYKGRVERVPNSNVNEPDGIVVLDNTGRVAPNLLPVNIEALTPEVTEHLLKMADNTNWYFNRALQDGGDNFKKGQRGAGHPFSIMKHFVIETSSSYVTKITYNRESDDYPFKVRVHGSAESVDSTRTRFTEAIRDHTNDGGVFKAHWFSSSHRGNALVKGRNNRPATHITVDITPFSRDEGYTQILDIEIYALGNDQFEYIVTRRGDSISDVHKIDALSVWN